MIAEAFNHATLMSHGQQCTWMLCCNAVNQQQSAEACVLLTCCSHGDNAVFYVQAPSEAESQCAAMCKQDLVNHIPAMTLLDTCTLICFSGHDSVKLVSPHLLSVCVPHADAI